MTAYETGLILPDRTDGLAIRDAMREQLEDDTEAFLYELYDEVSVPLAGSFQALLERAKSELKTLETIARSLDILDTDIAPPAADPSVDRIVWRQVARSSTLALFDWLVTKPTLRSVAPDAWAKQTCSDTLDFETFRRETSLNRDDATLAVKVSAQAITQSALLDPPRPLWYRGRYLTAMASAGQLWFVTTESAPMAWVPLPGKERAVMSEAGDLVSVLIPQATEVDLVRLRPWVGVEQAGQQLIVGPTVRQVRSQSAPIVRGVAVKFDNRCRSVMTAGGIRIACNTPGALGFSAPRSALTSYAHGFLLECDVVKDLG